MRYLKELCLCIVALSLVGCGKYHAAYGGKYYTKTAKTIAPITVPHGMHSPVAQQFYTVPMAHPHHVNEKPSLLPPDPAFLAYLKKHNSKKIHQHER